MADYRQIHVCIWKDSWFIDLESDHKLLFIYLFSNERANLAGLYDLSLKVIAFETDLDRDTIMEALGIFATAGKVFYRGGMVWVPNLLRHNAKNITSPKIQAHLRTVISNTRDCQLKSLWIEQYNQMVSQQYRMHTLSIPDPESESEQEQEQEHEQENEHEQETHTPACAVAATPEAHPTPAEVTFLEVIGDFEDQQDQTDILAMEVQVGSEAVCSAIRWARRKHIPGDHLMQSILTAASQWSTGPPSPFPDPEHVPKQEPYVVDAAVWDSIPGVETDGRTAIP